MKKRIIGLVLTLALMLGALSLFSCSAPSPEADSVTRMTVDVNPSLEFMIDDTGRVMSATALNDDGSVLLAGEVFVGKTPEEAIELALSLSAETGYLISGSVSADENEVKISVSGDSAYAEHLRGSLESKATDALARLNIDGKVARAEALGTEALRALAQKSSIYTEEELSEMSENELCRVIAAGRVETALLLTDEMRTAYFAAKAHKVSFAEGEAVSEVIDSLGGIYALTHASYSTALTAYGRIIDELDELRYSLLISPDSAYQKALSRLRDAKAELVNQKNYVASLDVNGEEYASATVTLGLSEEAYDEALAAFEALGEQVNSALEAVISRLRTSEENLRSLEDQLFDDNVKDKLKSMAQDIENSVNDVKDSFFDSFEEAHADDIEAIRESLVAKKEQLISGIEA